MASYSAIHRKPVSAGSNVPAALRPVQGNELPAYSPQVSPNNQQQPPPFSPSQPRSQAFALQQQQQQQQWAARPPPPQQQQQQQQHAHSRTISSNLYVDSNQPLVMSPSTPTYSAVTTTTTSSSSNFTAQPIGHSRSRRTASTSTTSSGGPAGGGGGGGGGSMPGRMPSTVSISLRRTGSSRSGQSVNSSSYVALMRKQKATVWCDRAQPEDPRQAAQLKAAKQRATLEVVGGAGRLPSAPSDKSSGGVRSKIRHHGQKPVGYSPATLLVGAQGVPARLSASEVGDEDTSGGDDDADSGRNFHHRSGSGRSSLAGGGARYAGNRPSGRLSTSSTPPSGLPGGSPPATMSTTTTNAHDAAKGGAGSEYFPSDRASKASGGSGSSGEERRFGTAGAMEAPTATRAPAGAAEDLSRRGSVDERAMTMRGPRLYVANPDLSD